MGQVESFEHVEKRDKEQITFEIRDKTCAIKTLLNFKFIFQIVLLWVSANRNIIQLKVRVSNLHLTLNDYGQFLC
jgi:hypothetical protein